MYILGIAGRFFCLLQSSSLSSFLFVSMVVGHKFSKLNSHPVTHKITQNEMLKFKEKIVASDFRRWIGYQLEQINEKNQDYSLCPSG